MSDDGNTILLTHHRDISSPLGTTVPYYLMERLSDRHSVHVVCRKRRSVRNGELAELDANVHDIDTGGLPIVSALLFHLIAMVYAPLIAVLYRVDVVYSFQSCIIQGWASSRAALSTLLIGFQSVPVRQAEDFEYYQGDLRGLIALKLLAVYSAVIRRLIERSSTVICLTEGIADKTEEVYNVDLTEAHVLGMGVDVEKFSRPQRSDGGAKQPRPWTITYVGTVAKSRDFEHVLEALSALEADVRFRIAGQGADGYREHLVDRAEQLDVADQVEWLGLVPHDEIPDVLATSDFTISPLPDIESYRISFPAKLLEYMAAETVVIASDIAPHRRLIDHGENGYLYDGSRRGLTEIVTSCIENEHAHREVERRARETAEVYDWDVIVREYEEAIFGG